jgi:hypothetical protein
MDLCKDKDYKRGAQLLQNYFSSIAAQELMEEIKIEE